MVKGSEQTELGSIICWKHICYFEIIVIIQLPTNNVALSLLLGLFCIHLHFCSLVDKIRIVQPIKQRNLYKHCYFLPTLCNFLLSKK